MKIRKTIAAVSWLAPRRARQEFVGRDERPEPPDTNETSATDWHWLAVAGSGTTPTQNRQARRIKRSDDTGLCRDSINRLLRPMPAAEVAPLFVLWCQEHGFHGEWLWTDLWPLYTEYFCSENEIVPLPNKMRAQFAYHLGLYSERFQVSVYEKGRRRRLTAYMIPEA